VPLYRFDHESGRTDLVMSPPHNAFHGAEEGRHR
jgi:hypothetical protein